MNANRKFIAFIGATLLLIASATTSAGVISITDLGDGPPVVVFSGFPGSFSVVCSQASETLDCDGSFTDAVSTVTTSAGDIGLYEDSQLTILSDYFNLRFSINGNIETFSFDFDSDVDGVSLFPGISPPTKARVVETGGLQSFPYGSLCVGCEDYTVNLTSDAPSEPAPAPATLALLGLGLAGMGLGRRRHLRKS